jgi:anti-anti-sigma factor
MSNYPGLDATYDGFVRAEGGPTDHNSDLFNVRIGSSDSLDGGAGEHNLAISGELDLASAPQLARALRLASGKVVIDCRSLSFMDAAGMGVLEEALNHVDGIRLMNVGIRVRRAITIVGLDREFLDVDS